MKISRVVIDVIERDTGSLKVIDERSDIGGKTNSCSGSSLMLIQ